MTLLAGVLLRDLDLHGLIGFGEAAEEGRNGFLRLEIDGAFLGLDDDVGRELAIERMEDVVGGAGAVGFGVAPIEVMVVDEGAVENDATVRARERRQGCWRRRPGCGRSSRARVGPRSQPLTVKPAKSGISE